MYIYLKNFLFILLAISPFYANATLIGLGSGLVYDDYHDVTWLADANHAKTSGYDDDGIMSWQASMNWASQLNYAGVDDWRLPTSFNQDGSGPCRHPAPCTDSEMGHLFYVDLGGTQGSSIYDSANANLSLFSNIITSAQVPAGDKTDTYWTSTDGSFISYGRKMYFAFTNGSQYAKNPNDPNGHGWGVAWAVHDGKLVVSEPGVLMLLATGLIGLAIKRHI